MLMPEDESITAPTLRRPFSPTFPAGDSLRRPFSPTFPAGDLTVFIPWRVVAAESGAATSAARCCSTGEGRGFRFRDNRFAAIAQSYNRHYSILFQFGLQLVLNEHR